MCTPPLHVLSANNGTMTMMGDPVSNPALQTPEFGPVHMNTQPPKKPGLGKVIETRIVTRPKASGFVRHIAIDITGTDLAGTFRAGQSFGVIPPGTDAQGKPHKLRLYSIASPSAGEDGHGNVLATTVKRTLDEHHEHHRLFVGVASNWLCDLQLGDTVPVTGPVGKRFLLPERAEEHQYVFMATGTGIAPFRGMTLELLARDPQANITLISGTPYATELLYDDLFTALAARHPNFRYLTAISRHEQADGGGPMYLDARLARHADELRPMLVSPKTLIYMCGIAGMEVGVYRRLGEILSPDELEPYVKFEDIKQLDDLKQVEGIKQVEGQPGALPGVEAESIRQRTRPGPRMLVEVY